MRRIISLVFYAALAMFGVVFTLLNLRSVTINYHTGQVELPLAAVVIISIALGVATGVLVCLAE